MALSVFFPCVTITYSPISKEQVAANPALKYLMYGSTAPVQETYIPWDILAMGVISVLLLSYLAYSVLRIFRLKAIHSKTQMGEFTFIETDLEEAPFSFFSNLFWKKSISIEEENGQKMLQHELVHIRQKHTWDRLFSQFICAIFWMNPFNWIMQKELQNIHEFIADRDAVGTGEVDAFAKMLLQTYYGNHFLNPSHSFYYSSIKRRIIMLTTSKTPKYAYLRKVAVLPLFAISLILISFQLSAQKPKAKKEEAAQFTVTMRPDSTTFSDPKTGKKVFSVATRDMPPPPTPPVLTLHGSGSEVKLITIDSTTVEFKGRNSEGKQVVFRAEKVGNTATSPKEKPLIVIDGVITTDLDMNKISPNNIQSMNVLKGEKATAKYAEKGANGVIEITTKKP
jgi:TonB-dependent SusC/RagA subfamily outer membrane receptor